MSNKRAGAPVEALPGIFTFMVVGVLSLFIFFACGLNSTNKAYAETKVSKANIDAIKSLNFFLQMDVDEEKKVSDIIIDSYLRNDNDEVDKLAKEYFSNYYGDWRLFIVDSNTNVFYDFQESSSISGKTDIFQSSVDIPVSRGEDFEFVEIILQLF